jgi:hypothetical protein
VIEPLGPDALIAELEIEKVFGPTMKAVVNNQKVYRLAFQQLGRALRHGLIAHSWAGTFRQGGCAGLDARIDLPGELGMGPSGVTQRESTVN